MDSINTKVQKIIEDLVDEEANLTIFQSKENLLSFNLEKISINYATYSDIPLFANSGEKCCLFGVCKECCNDFCQEDSSKYPVIFVHGHDFSRAASAEGSLNDFNKIQNQLEGEGYLNAGAILLGNLGPEDKGTLGKIRDPISVVSSYYLDIYKNTKEDVIVQTKADNIDTYAIRLRDIIDTVKYRTDRSKVKIVAHSMGGLVVRRYIQIFGSDSVDRIILLGTPNKGIGGSMLKYCSLFGAKEECDDMNKDSLFINKINNGGKLNIPVYNVIGVGCNMGSETGDGIVANSSAYLDEAKNFYVEGKCSESKLDFFHSDLINPDKYPEIYNIIIKSLK